MQRQQTEPADACYKNSWQSNSGKKNNPPPQKFEVLFVWIQSEVGKSGHFYLHLQMHPYISVINYYQQALAISAYHLPEG